jgi:hypothetical protein
VELAVFMVLLVPLAMYTLYLEDLLFYKLNQIEAVVASPWDAFHPDHRHGIRAKIEENTQRYNRLTYADHTSAWNTYANSSQDTDDERHHQALAAHQCWMAEGGEQVTCKWQEQATGAETEPLLTDLNRGGVMRCWARLGVQNYFLPEQFLHSARKVFDKKRWTGGSFHGNALNDPFIFPRESSSIVHDSWALNFIKTTEGTPRQGNHEESYLDPQRHNSNAQSEWTPWVAALYKSDENQRRLDVADQFARSLISDFLDPQARQDGQGDNVLTLPLAYKTDPVTPFQGFNPSGYQDDRVQRTRQVMEPYYMGMDPQVW